MESMLKDITICIVFLYSFLLLQLFFTGVDVSNKFKTDEKGRS